MSILGHKNRAAKSKRHEIEENLPERVPRTSHDIQWENLGSNRLFT